MLRINPLRAALALPTALAIALIVSPLHSYAAGTTVAAQLASFAVDETAPGGTPKAITAATANANDVVYAVYQALQEQAAAGTLTDSSAAAIASEALTTTAGKTRKDKDKISGRIVAAAILGSNGQGTPSRVQAIVNAVAAANGGLGKTALTATGKALALASGLKNATPVDPVLPSDNANPAVDPGAALAASAATIAGSASKTAIFATSVLKLLGTNTNNVPEFVNGVLDAAGANSDATAVTIARAVAKFPAVSGAVIAGRAADISNFGGVPSDTAVEALLSTVVKDSKLSKDVADAVGLSVPYLSILTSRTQLTTDLATANKKVAGAVASGVIRNVTAGEVDGVIGAAITAGGVTAANYATFGGQAAAGNTTNAAAISTSLFNRTTAGPADKATAQKIAIAVANSAATFNPNSAQAVGASVAASNRAGMALYAQGDLGALAAALAKGVNKNYTATGAIVEGVASAITGGTPATYSTIANTAITANPKAAAAITLKVADLVSGADLQTYAVSLATASKTTNASNIAIGAAIADPAQAGAIVKAIASVGALNKSTIKIATAVAKSVDIESISQVAQSIGTLFQPKTGGNKNLPKLTSLGSFAAALTKAINAKPVATKVTQVQDRGIVANGTLYANFSWHNRVDEIGEVAASLVNAAIAAGGTDAKTIAAIGTSIYKSVSKTLLSNANQNLADIKDVANDVAGAIFQSISITPVTATFTQAIKDALLDNTAGSKTNLLALLGKGSAAKYKADLVAALNNVKSANGGIYVDAGGQNEPLSNGSNGRYEVGSIIDPETPVVNL